MPLDYFGDDKDDECVEMNLRSRNYLSGGSKGSDSMTCKKPREKNMHWLFQQIQGKKAHYIWFFTPGLLLLQNLSRLEKIKGGHRQKKTRNKIVI